MTHQIVLEAEEGPWKIPVAPGEKLTVGRAEGVDRRIDERTVARKHLLVDWTGKECTIDDQASPGGTYLNDKLLRGPTAIKAGDRIRIGAVILVVKQS